MSVFRETTFLVKRHLLQAARNPIFIFMGVFNPVLYLALFTPLLKNLSFFSQMGSGSVLTLFIPGMLPIIAFSTGIFTGFSRIDEIRAGVTERFQVTPASRFAVLGGQVFFDAIVSSLQSLFFVLIAFLIGFQANVLGMLCVFILSAMITITTSAFGNAMALIWKSEDQYVPLVHGIHLPTLLLSGTLLPMSLAPKWLQILAHCNPIFYVVEGSRALAIGEWSNPIVGYAFLFLTPLMFLTLSWSTRVFKKATA